MDENNMMNDMVFEIEATNFFKELVELEKKETILSVDSVLDFIEKSNLDNNIKQDLKSIVSSHKHCEFQDSDKIFVLETGTYMNGELALICTSCTSALIEENMLSTMITLEKEKLFICPYCNKPVTSYIEEVNCSGIREYRYDEDGAGYYIDFEDVYSTDVIDVKCANCKTIFTDKDLEKMHY